MGGMPAPGQREREQRDRIMRTIPGEIRRDAALREAQMRYRIAAENGELEQPQEIDWALLTSLEDQGEYERIMAEREAAREPGRPYEHPFRFVNPWNRRGFDRNANESNDNFLYALMDTVTAWIPGRIR
jgi:hypothetical protein